MNNSNFNNFHLSDEQIQAINTALANLETAMKPLNINFTPEERKRLGRVNEQNKLFINKVEHFAKTQPELRSPDVNWEEFDKDYKSRAFLESVQNRLDALSIRANNSRISHDFDNYQDGLEDYAYTSFRARSKQVGYEQKYKEMKQFFSKNKKNTPPTDSTNPTTTD